MTPLEDYRRFFESLDAAGLHALDSYFAPDARFCDPFHDVRGVIAIRGIFEGLYAQCATARFVVDEAAGQSVGYLRWLRRRVADGRHAG